MSRLVVALLGLTMLAVACGSSSTVDAGDASAATTTTTTAVSTTTTTTTVTTTSPPTTVPPTTATSTTTTVAVATTATAAECRRIEDFDDSAGQRWGIVNDGVMGGRSEGAAALIDGVLTFAGNIETDGGGFSSIRGLVEQDALADAVRLVLRVRTDGRDYELLADDAVTGRDRRVTHYQPIPAVTAGEWADVEVPLFDMEARVFGRTVTDLPFDPALATVIGVILADGIDGPFLVEVDWIDACS